MTASAEERRRELDQAQQDLRRMVAERVTTAPLSEAELQEKVGGPLREQRIIVAWLRAEYTARLVHELSEKITGAENEVLLGNSAPDAHEKIEEDRLELAGLRMRHLDAYFLLNALEGWPEVAKRYENSRRR